ncbi:hypothetical protein [Xenorhabdus griffiniae]|uniref:Transcriptional regulator n=1 Tax=Xenorhabdus griffiniae TaxID=351672 RepID=A0ABY9XMF1_9GAMM|nr:hypothetical protein [Xenorhabdus griffiniae]MBD1228312.1 hypothetical protein [Xenorhabdus griffiniae]MBE8587749.1 hypothetical protein [Xenorhabdus griffiniae]WMV74051.1 hypothetical protein QL128_08675 [Xenorhabdus griffiniae]WNH03731.1 hypothetical protein QL112_008680 [Xenorhabdus griffiniae]
MNLKPIKTEQEYQDTLKAIAPLFDNQSEVGTPEFTYMEAMVLLIETYEAEHHPIEPLAQKAP